MSAKHKTYLNGEHWKSVTRMMRKKHPKCYCCNQPSECTHHRHYDSKGAEKPKDLIVLCHSCHNWLEDGVKKKQWSRKHGHDYVKAKFDDKPKAKPRRKSKAVGNPLRAKLKQPRRAARKALEGVLVHLHKDRDLQMDKLKAALDSFYEALDS